MNENAHSVYIIRTTSYRPPELLFGHKAYDCTLDLWATGCVVAEVINAIPHACSERARKWTLFDSGELGSDLALIKSIFETLGTPTEEKWPEVKNFADWGKMNFKEYLAKSWADILPHASEMGRDLVASLVKYQSTDRMSAAEVSVFMSSIIIPAKEKFANRCIVGSEARVLQYKAQ